MSIDIGDECTECRRDTSFGSGLFVNRIPSGTDEYEGYLCPDCQALECDICHKPSIEYGIYDGIIVCDCCNTEDKEVA